QFGASNEADGTDYEQSERAVSLRMTNEQDQVQVNAGTITNKEYGDGTGRMNTVSGSLNWGGNQVNAKFATVASDYWNGPTAYVKVPPSGHGAKANFLVKDRLSFNVGGSSYGQMEFNLNAGNTVAMSTVFRDGDGTLGRIFVEEWVMGQRVRIVELNLRVFTGGYFEVQMSRMNGVAKFQIATVAGLSGDDVSKYGASLVDAWTVEGFGDAEIDGMTTAFMKFEGYPATGMNWTDSVFDWVNVDYWKDLPNRFKSGDVVTADVATKKVYVNGVEDASLQTVGNQWDSFVLTSGENVIQPVASSWAVPFTAEIKYREAWY
uniref:phage distal tail protein n=1 Tax=Lacticaseibacillus suibinensis TaxID=2486011 RepID=UPI00194528A0